MARAIPKREWLAVEEDLCRTAWIEYLMERWLGERCLPGGEVSMLALTSEAGEGEMAHRVLAVQALQDFGWLEEPDSSASH